MGVCRQSPRTNFGTPIYAGGIHLNNSSKYSSITAGSSGSICEGTSPGVRYNEIISTWEFSNDGIVWNSVGTGSGSAGSGSIGRTAKVAELISTIIPIDTDHTLPDSKTYTMGNGEHMDVYFNGQLLSHGITRDYSEINAATVKFHFNVPVGTIFTYIIM